MIPLTVAAASSMLVKSSSSVRTTGGSALRRTAIRLAIAHRPLAADEAAPEVVPRRSGRSPPSARPGAVGEHDVDREHVRRRDPEARQCGPPALVATLPPIVHAACDDGSGA